MINTTVIHNVTYYFNSTNQCFNVGKGNFTGETYKDSVIAFPNSTEYTTVEITKNVNGYPVREIGAYAFCKCFYIKTVKIKAEITQINNYAFYQCHDLTSINIPSTCEFVGGGAISSVIWISNEVQQTAKGTLSVKFEPNSTLKTIGKYGIERKEVIIITYCGYGTPTVATDGLFYKTNYSVVYSPTQIAWGNTATIVDPTICLLLEEQKSLKCQTIHMDQNHVCPFTYIALIYSLLIS